MKIVRFGVKGGKEVFWGKVEGVNVYKVVGNPYEAIELSGDVFNLNEIHILPPCEPQKIVLVGLNYRDHAEELGMDIPDEPLIFLKPPTALIGDGDSIVYPEISQRVDYEAELAFVVSKKAKNVSVEDARDYIFGYTCLNDVTARDLQKKDGQWTRAKSFDTFCPVGKWIETEFDWRNKKIEAYLNGKLKQSSNTNNFIFGVEEIFSFVSKIMTLNPGDLISTGTPPGVGAMSPGDVVEVKIEGIGVLSNKIVKK